MSNIVKIKENPIEVVVVRSPLDRTKVIKTVLKYNCQNVLQIVNDYINPDIEGIGIVVSVNGKIIEENEYATTFLLPSDQIVIVPIIGDNETLMIVAMVALFVFAPGIAAAIGGGAGGWAVTAAGGLTFAGQVLTVGIMLAGGYLISSLAPKPSSQRIGGLGEDVSQFHSFNPATKQRQGLAIPRIFGKIKCYGNVIVANTELNQTNDKQILNLLIALSKGPIKGIVDYDDVSYGEIKINDQPITNFQDVFVVHRKGTLNQEIITYFDDTLNETFRETLVSSDSPVIYTTSNANFDELEVKISCPFGLYYQNDQSGLSNHTIKIKIEIGESPGGAYNTLFEGNIKDKRSSLVKRTFRTINSNITIDNGKNYNIKVTKISIDKTSVRYGDKINLSSVSEVITDDFTYPTIALAGINALASDQLSGSLNFSCIAEGSICRVYDGSAWINEYSDNPAWVLYTILSSPVFSGETEGDYVVERYDGVDPAQLDTESFYELAEFCDELVPITEDNPSDLEKRFIFNGGFDSESSVWESALTVCKMCRCNIVFNGTTLAIVIDKPTEVTQMFGMGNIVKGSFIENFSPQNERASEIEINFLDDEEDYNRSIVTIFNTSIPNNSNKVSIDLIGCTRKSQAWREGEFILRQNQVLSKTIEFSTSIDSIACQIGDVIEFSHDVPNWNQSGRVISSTNNTVTLSEPFIDENPSVSENYKITIRLNDDTIVTKDVLSISENIITITDTWTTNPSLDDIYQIGVNTTVNNPYRILEIQRTQEQNANIKAIEYNEFIYSGDDIGSIIPIDISYVVNPDDELVSDLSLKEEVYVTESGVIQRNIIISYDLPSTGSFNLVQIYSRISGSNSFELMGESKNSYFVIYGVLESTQYEIKIITQLNDLKTSSFYNSPSGFITTGSNNDLSEQLLTVIINDLQVVGGSTSQWDGSDLALEWGEFPTDENPSAFEENPSASYWHGIPLNFIADYEVKIFDYIGGALRRTEYVLEPRYTYTYETNFEDGGGTASRDLRVHVKVRDKFGRVSENPAILYRVQNPAPDTVQNLTMSAINRGFYLQWDQNTSDNDFKGYKVWATNSTPVDTSDDDDLIYKGTDNKIEWFPTVMDETWYAKVAAYDKFGETGLNISAEKNIYVEDITTISFDFPITEDIDWYDEESNPSAGLYQLAWSEGDLKYKGVTYQISSGQTNKKYVYWVYEENQFRTTDDESVAIGIGSINWVMAANQDGVINLANGIGNKIIHGGLVQAGTITANQMAANSITAENAALANAVITSAKIGNLEVETHNIEFEAITGVVTAFTAAEQVASGSDVLIQTINITLTEDDSDVVIVANGLLNGSSPAGGPVLTTLKLKRGATEIWTSGNMRIGVYPTGLNKWQSGAFFVESSPGAGNYDYKFYSTRSMENRYLQVMEVKR